MVASRPDQNRSEPRVNMPYVGLLLRRDIGQGNVSSQLVPQLGALKLTLFWGTEGFPGIDYRKKWHPYSNLSTGGPSISIELH